MFDELRDLYQEVIMDHNKSPRNFGDLADADATVQGHNPLCGDSLVLKIRREGDGDDARIADLAWEGVGCAISRSSASMMSQAVKGASVADARALRQAFHDLVTREGEPDNDRLGKLKVFAGVGEFPARVKCATLAWRTLEAALDGAEAPVTTE